MKTFLKVIGGVLYNFIGAAAVTFGMLYGFMYFGKRWGNKEN